MDLLEAAPAFIRSSELGGSTLRVTDLLVLVRNQLVPYCLSIVERLSPFQKVSLGRFHYIYIYANSSHRKRPKVIKFLWKQNGCVPHHV